MPAKQPARAEGIRLDPSSLTSAPGAHTQAQSTQKSAMQTFAERRGEEYVINGTKHFISNGGIAKLYLIHARSDRKLPLNQCRSVFLVPSDAPGFSIGKFHNKLGRRLLMTAELVLQQSASAVLSKNLERRRQNENTQCLGALLPQCARTLHVYVQEYVFSSLQNLLNAFPGCSVQIAVNVCPFEKVVVPAELFEQFANFATTLFSQFPILDLRGSICYSSPSP
jgi:hypothetical protein